MQEFKICHFCHKYKGSTFCALMKLKWKLKLSSFSSTGAPRPPPPPSGTAAPPPPQPQLKVKSIPKAFLPLRPVNWSAVAEARVKGTFWENVDESRHYDLLNLDVRDTLLQIVLYIYCKLTVVFRCDNRTWLTELICPTAWINNVCFRWHILSNDQNLLFMVKIRRWVHNVCR